MLRLAQKIRDLLFRDNLFLRVTIFITGALIGAIPLAAVLLGALSKNYDSALYILLALFAIFEEAGSGLTFDIPQGGFTSQPHHV